ncbi:hypothetical protein [Sorangium sp. So ce233]|uniref:hypothetical protein n=1 Tax=Sorangium sp. So ce233 TaxID=3133290 RepID=UPI003F5E9527
MTNVFQLERRSDASGGQAEAPTMGDVANHVAESGAAGSAGNADHRPETTTERLRSRMRRLDFMASAELFSLALHLTGASQADVAAAADVSKTLVGKWCRGEATIPADVVRLLLRRLTPVGIKILYLCAADLPLDGLAQLVQELNQLLRQRLEVKGSR